MQTSVNFQNVRQWPWGKIFVASIVILLVLSAILRVLTPPAKQVPLTPSVVTNDEGIQTTFRNFKYVGEKTNFPKELPGFVPSTTQQDILQALIARFQLSQLTEDSWESDVFKLSQQGDDTDITYSMSNSTAIPLENITDLQALTFRANQIIQDTFPNLSSGDSTNEGLAWQLTQEPILSFSDGLHLEAATEGRANLLATSFALTYQGVPIYFDKAARPQIELLLRSSGDIQKLSFTTKVLPVSKSETYELISVDQAIKNINEQNLGTVIVSTRDRFGAIELSELESGNLTSVTLEYRYDPIANLVYPHYRLSGSAKNQEKANLGVEILTPAVPVNPNVQTTENQ